MFKLSIRINKVAKERASVSFFDEYSSTDVSNSDVCFPVIEEVEYKIKLRDLFAFTFIGVVWPPIVRTHLVTG